MRTSRMKRSVRENKRIIDWYIMQILKKGSQRSFTYIYRSIMSVIARDSVISYDLEIYESNYNEIEAVATFDYMTMDC